MMTFNNMSNLKQLVNYNLSTNRMDAEGFIRNHVQQMVRPNPISELLSMPYHEHPDISQNLEALPFQLKNLFHKLFNPQKGKIILSEILPFKEKKSVVPFCHRLLTPKVESYRCYDCQIHPDSLLCEDCFKCGNHEGHRYLQLKEEGDCDCGSKDLIKESGFCHQHSGEEEIIEINSNEEFIFYLYVRQLFIWILKLIKINEKEGELLLHYFLLYLVQLNTISPYYNRLTTRALFTENNPMIDHIIYISLNAKQKGKLVQTVMGLFFKMLVLREFKEKLLISLISNYNKIQSFETSKYVKLFYPLLNQQDVVISAMSNNQIALRPERPFAVISFYQHLAIISDISPAAARAFITPLLLTDPIIFPFLQRIEDRCQKMNNLIVTVFPQFQKEQHMYYRLLGNIIRVIDDKNVLATMIRNYCKVIMEYSFKKNKIILVPQRILALIIYKYFDYDMQKVNAEQVRAILDLQQKVFQQQIQRNWLKFAQCIFQFSMNLNRTNYFQNYLNIYAKEKGQAICMDYLGYKIMAVLSEGRKQTYQSILGHIFRVDNDRLNREMEERADLIKAGNIFLKIIIEIVYSPRTETMVNSILSRQDPHLPQILKKVFQTVGEITQPELQNIGRLFNFGEISRNIIDSTLTFDPSKRKYTVKSQEVASSGLNLQFFVSLLHTKFSKFIQKKAESENYLQLDDNQQKIKHTVLNCGILYSIIKKQLMLIEDHDDDKNLIRELIRVIKTIKLAYGKQEKQYQMLFADILKEIRHMYKLAYSSDCPNRQFIEEIQKQIGSNTRTIKIQQSSDKETQRRKELLKLKKEQLMKNKKMKENQEKFLQSRKEQEKPENEQMCLICRQNKDIDQLCYVGKIRLTSLLFDFMGVKGENAIFKSCYHTVHYDCFSRLQKTKQAASCPLCKCAINILLPLENTQKYGLLEKISNRMEHVLNYFLITSESKDKRGFLMEAILYIAYIFSINLNDLSKINEKQLRLFRIIYNLMDHNFSFEDRLVRAETCFDLFMNKLQNEKDNRHLGIFRDLVGFIQSLLLYSANSGNLDLPLECINILSYSMSMDKINQIMHIINSFVSPPDVSSLEPIIISAEQITSKMPQQSQQFTFINFWAPPADVTNLLKLRDSYSNLCKVGHQICICLICQEVTCLPCKKSSQHVTQKHSRECLMFNTYSGGFLYYYHGLEIAIKCLYINDIGKTWKPQLKIQGFSLDRKLYDDVLLELKGGSMFNYLITTFEGLKGNNITDRI